MSYHCRDISAWFHHCGNIDTLLMCLSLLGHCSLIGASEFYRYGDIAASDTVFFHCEDNDTWLMYPSPTTADIAAWLQSLSFITVGAPRLSWCTWVLSLPLGWCVWVLSLPGHCCLIAKPTFYHCQDIAAWLPSLSSIIARTLRFDYQAYVLSSPGNRYLIAKLKFYHCRDPEVWLPSLSSIIAGTSLLDCKA